MLQSSAISNVRITLGHSVKGAQDNYDITYYLQKSLLLIAWEDNDI